MKKKKIRINFVISSPSSTTFKPNVPSPPLNTNTIVSFRCPLCCLKGWIRFYRPRHVSATETRPKISLHHYLRRRRPSLYCGRPRWHSPRLSLLLPLLHACRRRSRQPPTRSLPSALSSYSDRCLPLHLRRNRNSDSHLHFIFRPQDPRHRARVAGGAAAVLRQRREARELGGVREVRTEGGGDGQPDVDGWAVRERFSWRNEGVRDGDWGESEDEEGHWFREEARGVGWRQKEIGAVEGVWWWIAWYRDWWPRVWSWFHVHLQG